MTRKRCSPPFKSIKHIYCYLQREEYDCSYFKFDQYCVQRDKIQTISSLSGVGKRVDAHSGWTLSRWEGTKHCLSVWRCSWFTFPMPSETWMHQEVLVLCRRQEDASCVNTTSRLIGGCDQPLLSLALLGGRGAGFLGMGKSLQMPHLCLSLHTWVTSRVLVKMSLVREVTHSVLVQNESQHLLCTVAQNCSWKGLHICPI